MEEVIKKQKVVALQTPKWKLKRKTSTPDMYNTSIHLYTTKKKKLETRQE